MKIILDDNTVLDANVIKLDPQDIILVTVENYITNVDAQHIKEIFKDNGIDNKCIVLNKNMEITILKK